MKGKWQVLNKKTIFKNAHSNIQIWKVRTHQGKEKDFTIQKGRDFAVILAVTNDDKLVVIRQHYLNENKKIYSLVAGYIDPGENKTTAARRELLEEAGYSCKKIVYLGKSRKGKYATGYAHCFVGLGAFSSQKQELEDAEDIEVVQMSKEKFIGLLKRNEFLDAFTEVCAWRALTYLKSV
ncbi:MAG: NUDIX hydrolase [Patescibacteria group bacterium]|jgi:ADP-ribose pyrophosphatase